LAKLYTTLGIKLGSRLWWTERGKSEMLWCSGTRVDAGCVKKLGMLYSWHRTRMYVW